jgi:hypothetical protein
MGPFPTCAAFPALDGTLQNEYWVCAKDKEKGTSVGKGRLNL